MIVQGGLFGLLCGAGEEAGSVQEESAFFESIDGFDFVGCSDGFGGLDEAIACFNEFFLAKQKSALLEILGVERRRKPRPKEDRKEKSSERYPAF